jgi:RNase adaptor protein for sRNA GlmZ degradation
MPTDGMPKMNEEDSDFFTVRRAPNDRFYVTRKDHPVCSRSGVMLYFETEREALEFLAEIGDVVMS